MVASDPSSVCLKTFERAPRIRSAKEFFAQHLSDAPFRPRSKWREPDRKQASGVAPHALCPIAEHPMNDLSNTSVKAWVLALASVASFMAALDALVVTTALGTIRVDLGASIEALQWQVNAYNLRFA